MGDDMDKKKITNMEVKKKNRNDVFRYICSHEIVSNPDISYDLKISLPTATQITKELLEEGPQELKKAAFRLEMNVRKEKYDKAVEQYNNLKELFEENIGGM